MIKAILISLAAGGFITSFIEYKLQYNLIDTIKDKVLGLLGKGKAEVAQVESEIKQKL